MPDIVPPAADNTQPPQLFDVIYADPPWRYGNMTPSASPENHYPTMALEDICALDVPAAKNAVLYLWATAPLLPEGLQVMESWGFTYKSGGVWDKQRLGVGYWFRGQHEHLLVGVKGNWSPPPVHLRVSSIYSEHSGRHSKKPDVIRNQIATWWPDARRLEMFCRYPAAGWHVWGNQVDSSVADLPFERFDPHADPAQGDLFGGGEVREGECECTRHAHPDPLQDWPMPGHLKPETPVTPRYTPGEVESLVQQVAECEWLLRMTMDARDRAERQAEKLEARIARAESLIDSWEHDAPDHSNPVFIGRLRECLRRDPAPIRLRDPEPRGDA